MPFARIAWKPAKASSSVESRLSCVGKGQVKVEEVTTTKKADTLWILSDIHKHAASHDWDFLEVQLQHVQRKCSLKSMRVFILIRS